VEFGVCIFKNFAYFVCRRDFNEWIVLDLDLHKYLLSLLNRFAIKILRRVGDCPFTCLYFLFTLIMIETNKRVRVGLLTIILEEIFRPKIQEKHINLLIVLWYRILIK
jgi:hypothetical protein